MVPQVTLYIDDATDSKARAAAKAAGVSYSRWVAELIRERTCDEWPAQIRALAGSASDFPLRTVAADTPDVPRVALE